MPLVPTRLGARIKVALAPNFQKTQKMRQETRWKMQVKGRSNQDFPSFPLPAKHTASCFRRKPESKAALIFPVNSLSEMEF